MRNAVFINTGMVNGQFNIRFFGGFNKKIIESPNMMIKWMSLANELDITNEDLYELYEIHKHLVETRNSSDPRIIYENGRLIWKYYKKCKGIIHDLRTTCDMLIILTSLVKNDGRKIESIGDCRKLIEKGKSWYYDSYYDFFTLLARLDNSKKHHFTNDLDNRLNLEEPNFFTIFCSNNFNYTNYTIIDEPVYDLVEQFNNFYADVIKEMKAI